jgi:hypothetical protein
MKGLTISSNWQHIVSASYPICNIGICSLQKTTQQNCPYACGELQDDFLLGYFVVLCHLLSLYSMIEDVIKDSQIIFHFYNQGHWVCSCRGRLNTVVTIIIIVTIARHF